MYTFVKPQGKLVTSHISQNIMFQQFKKKCSDQNALNQTLLPVVILQKKSHRLTSTACLPYSIHRRVAKLVDSAQLKPWLKPAWYPYGKVIINSPASWVT